MTCPQSVTLLVTDRDDVQTEVFQPPKCPSSLLSIPLLMLCWAGEELHPTMPSASERCEAVLQCTSVGDGGNMLFAKVGDGSMGVPWATLANS